jgi:hypothetical protein
MFFLQGGKSILYILQNKFAIETLTLFELKVIIRAGIMLFIREREAYTSANKKRVSELIIASVEHANDICTWDTVYTPSVSGRDAVMFGLYNIYNPPVECCS